MPNKSTLAQTDYLLAAILSLTAGAVDVIGFLALGGLFTSHITGNLAVVAAHYTTGFFSEVSPMLAIPVFMAVLVCVSLMAHALDRRGFSARRFLLLLHALLLVCTGAFVLARERAGFLASGRVASLDCLERFAWFTALAAAITTLLAGPAG